MATEQEIDEIYDLVDDLLRSSKFSIVDSMLKTIPEDRTDSDILMSYLTITLAASSKLPSRRDFFKRCERSLQERGEDMNGLFDGLESAP